MKIVFFGAGGTIGSRILNEALHRGHEVTVVARDPEKFLRETADGTPAPTNYQPNQPAALAGKVNVVKGNALAAADVAEAAAGHDLAFSAIGGDPAVIRDVPASLSAGLRRAGVNRLLFVGGAGSLEVAPGLALADTPGFPELYKETALAHREALATFRADSALDWTYVSPAAVIAPGERTGKFRIGGEQLLTDENGESRISAEDFAVAFLDEAERPAHVRQRFTVAY